MRPGVWPSWKTAGKGVALYLMYVMPCLITLWAIWHWWLS